MFHTTGMNLIKYETRILHGSNYAHTSLPSTISYISSLPMILHYIWLPSFGHGITHSIQRANKWLERTSWSNGNVMIWTENDILSLMQSEEKTIYLHYCLPMQKLYFASYIILYKIGGVFLHPSYIPHELFWRAIETTWYSSSIKEPQLLLAERGYNRTICQECKWWNGLICSVPNSSLIQFLRQIIIPRYLTPSVTENDGEFTTGCYLLEELGKYTDTATTPNIISMNDTDVRKSIEFVSFHIKKSDSSTDHRINNENALIPSFFIS